VKRYLSSALALGIMVSSLSGETLKQNLEEVITTNPIVVERLKNYRVTQQDLNIAESEFYPKVDLKAGIGYTKVGAIKQNRLADKEFDYTGYETSLTLTQNLFDGFSTLNKIDYQEARIFAAAYNYVEKVNDIAFQMTTTYINVLKAHELLQTAKENIAINEGIYAKVKELYDAGLTADSEVKKIQSSLALARSNFTVQKNNTRDAEHMFRRVLGRLPNVASMKKPFLDLAMPQSVERAALYAIKNNPSLLVSSYNIKGSEALYKQKKKEYYPKVDLEVSQTLNDVDQIGNGYDQPDDRFKARIIVSYNLFKGGADVADVQKHLSSINQEVEIKRDLRRQVIESLDYSWNAYEMIAVQLQDLREYKEYAEVTLELNKDEYDLGRRTLLDLLSAQNDVINARTQIITAEYDYLASQYRILDAMGILVSAVLQENKDYLGEVNLVEGEEADEVLDKLPITLDSDGDKIADDIDLCDNSLKNNAIMPYGCEQKILDDDRDGVADKHDQCLDTLMGVEVDSHGCPLDTDKDGVFDYEDECPKTPPGYKVDVQGCAIATSLSIPFQTQDAKIPVEAKEELETLFTFLKENQSYSARFLGYSDATGDYDKDKLLSAKRAKMVRRFFEKYGIEGERLSSEGRSDDNLIVQNSTPEDRVANRYVDVELVRGAM